MKKCKDNIILIGMPGVGKSTVGVVLAKIEGYHFIDADIVIQQQERRLLKDIIASEGVEGFIDIENRINTSIECGNAVIATGGSVVYGKEAMEHYKEIGTIVYLKVGYRELKGRLGNIKNRGVVLKEGQNLETLYEERCPLYEKYADVIVDETGLNVEQTIEKILNLLER
jgi:shikimate kinase